jgi:hypothetical protein
VIVTNVGGSVASGVELRLGVTPNRRLKNLNPNGLIAIPDIAPGESVTQVWTGKADKRGAATIRAQGVQGGVDTVEVTRVLTIVK